MIAAFCAAVFATGAMAQEAETTDTGNEILPASGEFGLGFNVVPLVSYLGANTNFSQGNYVLGNNAIFGKYMLTGSTAVRAHVGVTSTYSSTSNYVFDDTQNSPDSLVTDVLNQRNHRYTFGAGYEVRKGKGRIQGIFGADVMFSWQRNQSNYEYGNDFSIGNQAPTTTNNFFAGTASPQGERIVSNEGGSTFGAGVRPFVGIEYYFAPRISIGAEFGFNVMYQRQSEARSITEYFDPNEGTTGAVLEDTEFNAGGNSVNLNTSNFNGAVVLMFYF